MSKPKSTEGIREENQDFIFNLMKKYRDKCIAQSLIINILTDRINQLLDEKS